MRPKGPKARTRALLPQPAARLLGLVALASIGALEWQRLVGGLSSGHALLWVLVAVGGAFGVLLVERLREGWLRAGALLGVAFVALFLGLLAVRRRARACSSRATGTTCSPGSGRGCRRSGRSGCRT